MTPDAAGEDVSEETQKRLDPAVVAELYSSHGEDLRAFLVGILKNRDEAAEALQVTFTKAVESGHTAREESFRGWLFRVAFHEAMNLRRRRGQEDRSCRKVAWSLPEGCEGPEERLVRQEDAERVRATLLTLPVEQQQVVRMRIYDEKPFGEIANELGIPLGTVLSRMRLALKKLQDRLSSKERQT